MYAHSGLCSKFNSIVPMYYINLILEGKQNRNLLEDLLLDAMLFLNYGLFA